MRRVYYLFILFSFVVLTKAKAQDMNPEKLSELITQVSDTVMTNSNTIQFMYQERPLICVYDENANRMRIISPIVETKDLKEEQLLNMLVANFHSALDVKYALSDEVIWSVFIHPLKELGDHQVLDAISQVHAASVTFGTSYSSTNLVFPGNTKKKEAPKEKKLIERG
ncbi:hypothetical protein FEE95_14560 [Maribacter algarum]|uniref:YbjN domain-containing protein n=1 Tax=Maribacter algarum (ex Zhang et al. 2020) TaxID=2578118 RepID=A0A5S3PT60_9FLAO|nr:hypothetical protein [Maribacter algarum]TMM55870.1 hypothetical protein FEE95_14560 [Maribacter algarum]